MTQKMQWVRFYKLSVSEDFYVVPRLHTKTGFFTGRSVLNGTLLFVMPWRKVRSTRPFGKLANCTVGLNNVSFGPRPPVPVTPGGDRTPETIGGNELTPSA